MTRFLLASLFLCSSFLARAQAPVDTTSTLYKIDKAISSGFQPVTDVVETVVFYSFEVDTDDGVVSVPLVLVWLIFGAVFFTIFFKFVNIRRFGTAINVVRGKYEDPDAIGEVTHFQALTAALSATVGLGNIAGVAVAISVGGPGATFWMICAGLLGMSSKFVECTLGVKYRNVDADGTVHGGPMYYLTKGLKAMKMGGFGRVLAIGFAVFCVGGSFGGGNMFQANQAQAQFSSLDMMEGTWVGTHGWIFGLIMAVLVGAVIIGGIKSIAKVTDKIVPVMVILYVAASLYILFSEASEIPGAFGLIFSSAFAPQAIAGGVLGSLIQGFRRAAFSNEAGIGSAPIAHSAVKTSHPVSEGLVSLLEPFIDTVVVCTMTALVLVITGVWNDPNLNGIDLTSAAYSSQIDHAEYVLAIAVVLFAFSTMISWSYYGLQAWQYLFGYETWKGNLYKSIFCFFVIVGASVQLKPVIGFSDAMIFAMAFPNLIGCLLLAPQVRRELNDFVRQIKNGGIAAKPKQLKSHRLKDR